MRRLTKVARRWRYGGVMVALVLCAGCFTPSGRVGLGQIRDYTRIEAENDPSELRIAAARLADGLARQGRAPKEVPEPTAENMNQTSEQMKVEERIIAAIKGFFVNLARGVGENIPVVGPILAGAGLACEWLRRKKKAFEAASLLGVKLLNKAKHLSEAFAAGKVNKSELADAAGLLVKEIQGLGALGGKTGAILSKLHAKLKEMSEGQVLPVG